MSRFVTSLITANRLGDGRVVFYAEGADWVEDPQAAVRFETQEALDAALVTARAAEATEVVGPYAIEVGTGDGPAGLPTKFRERIRLAGPTVRTDLGPQADGAAPAQP